MTRQRHGPEADAVAVSAVSAVNAGATTVRACIQKDADDRVELRGGASL